MEASNNAKLREALLQIQGIICSIDHDNPLPIIYKVCEDALAAPARNCDVYDAKTAEKEFMRQTGSKSIRGKSIRWLYAENQAEIGSEV